MNDLTPQEGNRSLTPQEKRQYLLNKYVKRDYKVDDLNNCKKYAVYFNPAIDRVKEWTLVCVCNNEQEALKEILWRKKYHETGDGDLVLDNDDRFKTWRDETKNVDIYGRTIEPGQELMNINYNESGGMLQVIATNNNPNSSFKGFAYYTQFDLNEYRGFYKIEQFFEV